MATISRSPTAINAATTGFSATSLDGTSNLDSSALDLSTYDHALFNLEIAVGATDDHVSLTILGSDGSNYGTFVEAVVIDVSAGGTIYFPFMIDKPPSNVKVRLSKVADTGAAHTVTMTGVGYKYATS